MTLNDKVQLGDTPAGTSTSTTTTSQWQTYNNYKAEQGWECPRCGRINAPWVRQCDCSRSSEKWDITWNKDDYTKPWWYDYKVTCVDTDTFKVHPDSTIYQVGGSDYKVGDTYVNVGGTQSNKVDSNSATTARNSGPSTLTNTNEEPKKENAPKRTFSKYIKEK